MFATPPEGGAMGFAGISAGDGKAHAPINQAPTRQTQSAQLHAAPLQLIHWNLLTCGQTKLSPRQQVVTLALHRGSLNPLSLLSPRLWITNPFNVAIRIVLFAKHQLRVTFSKSQQ